MSLKIKQALFGGGGVNDLMDLIVPVGIVLEFGLDVDPNTIYKGTKWERYGDGRVTVGKNTADADFNVVKKTGGVKSLRLLALIGAVNDHAENLAYCHTVDSSGAYISKYRPIYNLIAQSFQIMSSGTLFKKWNHNTVVMDFTQQTPLTKTMNPYIVVNRWIRTA